MATDAFYRGGNRVKPLPHEVRVDPATGLLRTTHGISVWTTRTGLKRFGGPFQITFVPEELRIIQRGRNPAHFEVVPAFPMPLAEYEDALAGIVLVPA